LPPILELGLARARLSLFELFLKFNIVKQNLGVANVSLGKLNINDEILFILSFVFSILQVHILLLDLQDFIEVFP